MAVSKASPCALSDGQCDIDREVGHHRANAAQPAPRGFPSRARILGLLLASVALPSTTGCGTWHTENRREFSDAEQQLADTHPECEENESDWECDPATPLEMPSPVVSMVIVPDLIQAENGSTFSVVAHLFDADGNPVPDSDTSGRTDIPVVAWSGDGMTFDLSGYSHEAKVTVALPSGSGPANLVMEAKVPGPLAMATATVMVEENPQGDRMLDRFDAGSLLNAGLYVRSAGDCSKDRIALYTNWAPLEALGADCPGTTNPGQSLTSVVFFSPDQRFKRMAEGWTMTPVTVMRGPLAAGGLPPEEPAFSVPLRVWRGVTTHETKDGEALDVSLADVIARAQDYEDNADSILARNRAGVVVHVSASVDAATDFKIGSAGEDLVIPSPGGAETVESTTINFCRYIAAHVAAGSFGQTPLPAVPRHLEVVFVHTTVHKAWACSDQDVILLRYGAVVPNTLAHEIGHKLALNGNLGHTTYWWNQDQGFTTSNIMWSFESDEILKARDHLSLGQAFRMNRHKSSLTTMAPDHQATVDCGEDKSDAEGNDNCPCLGLDLQNACEAP